MKRSIQACLIFGALCASTAAFAHPGHEEAGFAMGFAHPFTGADHLLAMLAVGLWAAQAGGSAVYALPLAFVAMMLAGSLLDVSTLSFTPAMAESLIAASVLALGLLVATRARVGAAAGAALVGVFALFHGLAHGAELGSATSAAPGFVLASALLLGIGIALGQLLRNHKFAARVAGLPIAAAGMVFMAQALAG